MILWFVLVTKSNVKGCENANNETLTSAYLDRMSLQIRETNFSGYKNREVMSLSFLIFSTECIAFIHVENLH